VPDPAVSRRSLLAALLLLIGLVSAEARPVIATLSATTVNPATLSAISLYSPTSPAAAPLGHTVSVSWTASAPQNGSGYVVSGLNVGGSSSICPATASSYAFLSGTAGTSYTDSSSLAGGTDGTYVCYLIRSGYDPVTGPTSWAADPLWTSANTLPTAKTPIGFFATGVSFTNGGTANTLDAGDTIVLTFSQAVDTTTVAPVTGVCSHLLNSTIYLGMSLTCGTTGTVGTLAGMTLSNGLGLDGIYGASAAWSNGNRTFTITVGSLVLGTGASTVASGTETFTPLATISSQTGGLLICTTASCKPTTTTRP